MKMSTIVAPMLTAAVLVGGGTVAVAQETDSEAALAPPPIEVSVDCDSIPEVVIITNNCPKPIKLKSVGSTWQKRAGEPYKVKKVLRPGKRATYTFGAGKGGKRLSGSYVFDNKEPREGVVVSTSKGRVKVSCDKGTNRPAAPPIPAEVDDPGSDTVEGVVVGEPVDALALLATLPVEAEVEDGYSREQFKQWVDADSDGCDTRQEVLIAESLTPVTVGDGCRVEDGMWFSAADGDTLTNPASVDINHVVPLKEAWASGAHTWTLERREAFANDLFDERTLQAVSAGANRQQGQNDPAAWLPSGREVACQFVNDWVAIKATWGLSVDDLEREAIELTLQSCPDRIVMVTPR
jgi:hypothetical protein